MAKVRSWVGLDVHARSVLAVIGLIVHFLRRGRRPRESSALT